MTDVILSWTTLDEELEKDEVEEVRAPITMEVDFFTVNGDLSFRFSENFHPLEFYQDWNLTSVNENIERLISIKYTSQIEFGEEDDLSTLKLPELIRYKVLNFTETHLVLKVEFKNPLFVS